MSVTLTERPKPLLRTAQQSSSTFQCLTVFFDRPTPDYLNYVFHIASPDNTFIRDIAVPTSSLLFVNPSYYFTICRNNLTGLVPFVNYAIQVAGFDSSSPPANVALSFPTFASLGTGDLYYGPPSSSTGVDSVNSLNCSFIPPYITCMWNNGNRLWIDAYLNFNCTRMVMNPAPTVYLAKSYQEKRVQNTGNVATLPTATSIFLPSGCLCPGKLTAIYPTQPTRVDLIIVSPSGAVNTDKSPVFPNTPLQDTLA
jgi:hypothetical protein